MKSHARTISDYLRPELFYMPDSCFMALLHEAMFSCNLQRSGVSRFAKSPPVSLLVCKIITLQVARQLVYI